MRGPETVFDLAIVGGGVNGCCIARDAAGRGLSVYLCEQDDLASGTSSRSTKLIHGGLRYLEHYAFRLVREALEEREVLWAAAPHIIWPLRFVLPHHAGLRPAWLLRLGLFLYDNLGGRRKLPATRTLDLRVDPAGTSLRHRNVHGFEYSDCWVEDSRFVVLNAVDAHERGAVVQTRRRLVGAAREGNKWRLIVEDRTSGLRREVRAKILVNAAGAWVGDVLGRAGQGGSENRVRMVKGSHIVVRKLFDHDRCYIFQNSDGRIVFAIPYQDDFTLIGTTDLDYKGDPGAVAIAPEEVTYLCDLANRYFVRQIGSQDVVWSYSGVRALYDDGASRAQDATRDYVLDLNAEDDRAPLLTIYGGKITTARRLAEAALKKLSPYLPAGAGAKRWTETAALPGGDFPATGFETLVEDYRRRWPKLDPRLLRRLARAYGTRTPDILHDAVDADDLGSHFGANLYEAEVRYLVAQEWARTAQDILWRRSKLGLHVRGDALARLEAYFAQTPVTEQVR